MTRLKITNSLKGALGETYYKELCSQRSWAYCSLETINSCTNLDVVIFKMGFKRICVSIPKSMQPEIMRITRPSNQSVHNPSFVFDYLACKIRPTDTSHIHHPEYDDFCWAEIKTGLGIFSDNQYKMLSKIRLPIAVFHIENIMIKPEHVEMDWDIMSGEDFARTLDSDNDDDGDDDDDDYYSNGRHNSIYDNYSDDHKNSYNSQHEGIVAKYSGKCVACDQRIIAGKDKIAQDDDGDWVHIKCA